MSYRIRATSTFERQLRKLAYQDRERALRVIAEIQGSPRTYKSLGGQLSGARSARAGDLRVIYTVDEGEKLVVLLYVGRRERVYE